MEDMGPRPSPKHSIDRKDNDKGYSPDNCRWTTREIQNSNRRTVKSITHNGRTETMKEWARIAGVGYTTFRQRLLLGWSMEKALNPDIDGRLV
jgi:hypothetical protein